MREAVGLLPLGGTKWSGWAEDILLQDPALAQNMTVKRVAGVVTLKITYPLFCRCFFQGVCL